MQRMEKRQFKWESFGILILLISLGCLFVFHSFLFGNETLVFGDVGSDTREQYIMWYNGLANRIRTGTFSFWDFHNGLGINQYNLNLTEPFLVLVYLGGAILGPSRIPKLMVLVQILKVVLSGGLMYLFLSRFYLREEAKVLSGFLYAFNGYLMVWGQHYQMGTIIVLLPLLLYFIEKNLEKPRAAFGIAFSCGLIILNGYYQGYMTMLLLAVYVTGRVWFFLDGTLKEKMISYLRTGFAMVFGVLMGALNLIPSFMTLSETARLNSNSSLFARMLSNLCFWGQRYYDTLLFRLFGNNLQGAGNAFVGDGNYYEAPNMFFSALFIILLLQYLFLIPRQKKTVLQKICQYLGVLIGVFMVTIKLGSLIFNGFAYAFSRHTFLLMPFFAMICAWTLSYILDEKKVSMIGLLIALVLCVHVYMKAYRLYPVTNYESNALILLVGSVVMISVLLLYASGNPKRGMSSSLVCLLLTMSVFITVVSDACLTYQNRETVKKTDASYFTETYYASTKEALDWIRSQDDSFYRVEKDYSDAAYYLESLAQDYYGVSTYNSVQNSHILQFVSQLWPQLMTGYDINHHSFRGSVHEQTMASLVGVKYLLSHNEDLSVKGYQLLNMIGDVFIYRNTDVENIASFYTKTLRQKTYKEKSDDLDTWDLLSDVLITKDKTEFELTKKELKGYTEKEIPASDALDTTADGMDALYEDADGMCLDVKCNADLVLQKEQLAAREHVTAEFWIDTDSAAMIRIYVNDKRPYSYYSTGNHAYRLALPAGVDTIRFEADDPEEKYTIRGLRFYGSDAERSFSEAADITMKAPEKDDLVNGEIVAQEDGMMMLAIPYQSGWKVTVDGVETEPVLADYGFIAVPIRKGSHTFTASFETPGLKLAAAVSGVSTLIWLILLIVMCFLRKNEEEKLK